MEKYILIRKKRDIGNLFFSIFFIIFIIVFIALFGYSVYFKAGIIAYIYCIIFITAHTILATKIFLEYLNNKEEVTEEVRLIKNEI